MKNTRKTIVLILNIVALRYSTYSALSTHIFNSLLEEDIQIARKEKEFLSPSFFDTHSMEDWLMERWEMEELRYDATTYFSKWNNWTLSILLIYNLSFFTKKIIGKIKNKETLS